MLPPSVLRWLRLEGLAVFALSIFLYGRGEQGWLLFVSTLLLPDLSMAAYFGGARRGATVYNLAHNYAAPLALAAFGVLAGDPLAVSLALVWTAHIGMDRMLGYGLKMPTGFHETHLGAIRTGVGGR